MISNHLISNLTQHWPLPMTLSDLERCYARNQIFQAALLTVWPRTTQFGRITREEERLFWGSATPLPQGGGVPIFGIPFYLCVHHLSQNYQLWRCKTCGEGRVSWGQPRLASQESGVPWLQFWRFPVFMPKPFNAERPSSAW